MGARTMAAHPALRMPATQMYVQTEAFALQRMRAHVCHPPAMQSSATSESVQNKVLINVRSSRGPCGGACRLSPYTEARV